jgi:hypothetical protein
MGLGQMANPWSENEDEDEHENDMRIRGHAFLGTTWESLDAGGVAG